MNNDDGYSHHFRFKHLSIQQQRSLLPIAKYKHEILYALEKFRTIILIGETGCGKSTQIPRYLYDAGMN
jgi:ATP-dependent RNA helicase DDX35